MDPKERRAQILGQAARLFGAKGYHDTSISDIIDASGVARGTFYLYFENKRNIFEVLLDDLLRDITDCIQVVDVNQGSPSARQQLLDNIMRVIELFSNEQHLLAILFKGAIGFDKEFDSKISSFYNSVIVEMEGSLRLGQTMGIVRSCNTKIAAQVALGAFKEMLLHLKESEKSGLDVDAQEIAAEVLDIFSRGVLEDGVSIP